jgi:flagellar hook-length control protein FliK
MTTTSVKSVANVANVGNVVSPGAQAANIAVQAADSSFQTVWNNQTGSDKTAPRQDENTAADKAVDKAAAKAKPGEDLRAKDSSRKNVRTDDADQTGENLTADNSQPDEKDVEAAMEVVASAVTELVQQVADTFEIPVEAVQEIMDDMNLQPADLLQPENLSNLLLEAGGAQDSLALLTDGQLYENYQTLMEQGKEVLEQCSDQLNLTPEQLVQTVETAPTPVLEKTDGKPAIEISVEREDSEPVAQTPETENAGAVQDTVNVQENSNSNASNGSNTNAGHTQHEGHEKQSEGTGNLVLQTINDTAFDAQIENEQAVADTRDVDTEEVMRQIMDYMRIQVKPEASSLEMQLHPASLGTLQIQVASKGGVVTANFVTQNEAVKAALESQMVQLKESFAEQGVKVEAIEVTVQTHQFEENLEQGQGGQSQETEAKRTRTRRITLSGADEMDLPEDLEEEDQITAQMMAANGNTVDYTA